MPYLAVNDNPVNTDFKNISEFHVFRQINYAIAMNYFKTLYVFILIMTIIPLQVFGQDFVPFTINYQGILLNSAGEPVMDNTYDFKISIFDALDGGNNLWDDKFIYTTQNGIYSLILGSEKFLNPMFFNGAKRYIEVQVRITGDISQYEILQPRIEITSTAYAYASYNSLNLGGNPPGYYGDDHSLNAAEYGPQDVLVVHNSGNVGIDVENPSSKLAVNGTIETTLGGVKFPDGTLQSTALNLKTYDSDWFEVTTNTDYIRNHNLGSSSIVVSLWFKPNLGSEIQYGPIPLGWGEYNPDRVIGASIYKYTQSDIIIRTGDIFSIPDLNAGPDSYLSITEGYLRVTIIAF